MHQWKSAKQVLNEIRRLCRIAARAFALPESLQSQHKIKNFCVPAPFFILQREDAAYFYLH